MMNFEQPIEAFEGIEVKLGNKVVKLEGMNMFDLYELIAQSDEESQELINQLQDKLGKQVVSTIMAGIVVIANEVEESLDEDYEEEEIEVESSKETPLKPIKMGNMDDFYTFMPNLVVDGLDKHTEEFAYAMGLFNSGYTNSQVFTAIESKKQRQHEVEMTKLKHQNDMELAKLQMEHELEIAKLQLENAKIQADLAKKQIDIKQMLS